MTLKKEEASQEAKTYKELQEKLMWGVSLNELLTYNVPELEYLVSKLIPKHGLTILGGKPKSFKSMFIAFVVCCMAMGTPVCGLPTKKVKVLIIDKENGVTLLKERIIKFARSLGMTEEDRANIVVCYQQHLTLDHKGYAIKSLQKLIDLHKPDVFVIDSLVRFFTGDENSSKDARKIYETIKHSIEEAGVSWIILHHEKKSSFDGSGKGFESLRGSSDIAAQASSILTIESAGKNKWRLKQTASRNGPMLEKAIEFEVRDTIIDEQPALEFEYRDVEAETDTFVAEEAAEAAMNVILEKGFTTFRSGDIYSVLGPLNYGRNSIGNGLKLLQSQGKIRSIGHQHAGKWEVIHNTV